MTWRPMATAPKDGTWILVWTHHGGQEKRAVVLHWSDVWSGNDGDFRWSDDEYAVGGVTHWMPLPEPPSEQ